jgi:hypothetical protein
MGRLGFSRSQAERHPRERGRRGEDSCGKAQTPHE